MRIGLVVENLDPCRGGVEQWTNQFAGWLLSEGHEVHIVAKYFGQTSPGGIVRHTVAPTRSRCAFAASAETVLRELRLDVIHDMGAGWYCDVFQPHGGSRRAAFERNLALVRPGLRGWKRCTARVLPRYRDFDRLLARQYVDDGRVFLALSRMVAGDFRRHHAVEKERIRLVYNGVDTARFSPDHRGRFRAKVRAALGLTDEVLLLIIAHNFRLKGVPTLVRAARRLAHEGHRIKLAVVGGKGDAKQSRSANHPRSDEVVHFLGPVNDPVPYYAAADIYVHPTYYDPCSLVVLEALASGLPVVTSRFNGAGELITPGREGYLVADPGDAAGLVDCLRPLMDADRRAPMGAAARSLSMAHSLEYNCRQIVDVYQQIDRRSRKAA